MIRRALIVALLAVCLGRDRGLPRSLGCSGLSQLRRKPATRRAAQVLLTSHATHRLGAETGR